MSFRASYKYARVSPRKVRPVADMVRGQFADDALDLLRFQTQRGARMLEKLIRSAIGNAQDPEQSPGHSVQLKRLFIAEVRVDGGPMFKRIRPRARGMAHQIKKRMSHLHVVLEEM
ncbi:50S ribosomal protein L22 [Lignipirellula cremea]|uniref:Large ribosomal subunit protein uL22 n=1 Tax=Lignipirellula cremea TaxID=2528010 RepID=A0A518DMZ0_9BACT|nr:50S ribosomal protein L22 [Lignipirellula cremea]QDU93204.1 50S ribosomal protein L22 [Lignipirellula cremea]